jgi:diguanylate cyclase (GGDEF)-like protein
VSCADRQAPDRGAAALAETVPVTLAGGRVVARVVAWQPLDDDALRTLRAELGIRSELALLDTSGGTGLTVAAGRHAVVADTARDGSADGLDPRLTAALRSVADGGRGGAADGARFTAEPDRPGSPFAVVAVTPVAGGGLQRSLGLTVLAGTALCIALVRWIAGRLTRPLLDLTGIAERWRAGELGARSGIDGDDEVGRLGVALDAMATELQTVVAELEASRDALSETFERFGEALGRTHDLDGLLRVLAESALTGADAVVATALLCTPGGGLEERAAAVDPAAEGAPPSLPPEEDGQPAEGSLQAVTRALTTLAGLAVDEAHPVWVERLPGVGPAVAMPMRREEKVIGVLTVARRAGAPSLDDTALAAVGALASHAGTAVGNVQVHEEVRRLSVTDPLTGAGNVRQLSTTLSREVERAHRFGRPLSVLMLDLDHFKAVNDTHGHDYGDVVLREFARRLSGCLREVDTVARYGGEEFAVVLPETDSEGATRVAERILEAIRTEPFGPPEQPWPLTTSIGIASYPIHGRVAAEILRSADTALYTAKRDGRDRWAKARRATRSRAVSQAG